ncbi:hypothetical protein [Aliikangiella coralliicola]|uniref:Uncharacterized protein n=1 Tax=Aliikangiella coralliicola TaxID=2592383 RepID=A0A545UCR9_9GAMM|nr:hypothetical protein [Aliikangiella coralliicola]TQV87255.1 hypothetical protein FLL46_12435 [Aliikangiella coralliicola]
MGDVFNKSDQENKRKATNYMVSPHAHANNFLRNVVGSNIEAHYQKTGSIVPVFKDQQQREAFYKETTTFLQDNQKNLDKYKSGGTHNYYKLQRQHILNARQMAAPSASPKFDLQGIDEYSDVIVQGHGAPGRMTITSDNPDKKAVTRSQTVQQVASLLDKMKLPDANQVRANSCHSAAAHYVKTDEKDIIDHFQKGTAAQHHGGDWGKTFAGGLEKELKRLNHHNRVEGYLGATSQSPGYAKDQTDKSVFRLNVALVKGGTGPGTKVDKVKVRYEKGGLSKVNLASQAEVNKVAAVQKLGTHTADHFRAKLAAAQSRHSKGTHPVQRMIKEENQRKAKSMIAAPPKPNIPASNRKSGGLLSALLNSAKAK